MKMSSDKKVAYFAIRFILFLPVLLVISSCNHFQWILAVQTPKTSESSFLDPNPEVTATNQFQKLVNSKRLLAYKPPDSCIDETASRAKGDRLVMTRQVIKTKCGFWLAELERAFASNGYQVISWATLRKGGKTIIEMAKERGVDILLQINSLEAGFYLPVQASEVDWSFYESDEGGLKRKPVSISREKQEEIISITPKIGKVPVKYLAASLDVTAIDMATNQAVWFFRQTLSKKLTQGQSNDVEELFYCYHNGACHRYSYDATAEAKQKKSSGNEADKKSREESQKTEDPYAYKEQYKLIRMVVDSLVKEFSEK
jgi:hypothetical protein